MTARRRTEFGEGVGMMIAQPANQQFAQRPARSHPDQDGDDRRSGHCES